MWTPKCSRLLVPEKKIKDKRQTSLTKPQHVPFFGSPIWKTGPTPYFEIDFLGKNLKPEKLILLTPHWSFNFFFLRVSTRVLASGHPDVSRGLPALDVWDHTKPPQGLYSSIPPPRFSTFISTVLWLWNASFSSSLLKAPFILKIYFMCHVLHEAFLDCKIWVAPLSVPKTFWTTFLCTSYIL